MRKVMFIVPSLSLGGAERSLVKAANAIHVAGHEVLVVVLCVGDHTLANDLHPNIKVFFMGARGTASPQLWLRTRALVRKLTPQSVIGWSTYANLVAIVVTRGLTGIKVVISERNYLPRLLGKERTGPIRRIVVRMLIRRLYPLATMITANSEGSIEFLRRYIGKGPAFLKLPNLIDIQQHDTAGDIDRATVPQPPRELVRILAIGRLDNQKGFDVLLDAMLTIRKSTGVALLIVGSGPEASKIRLAAARARLLSNNPYIYQLPADPNSRKYYEWADIVVVPSRHEGFPNVLLEAMAFGKPVIASNCKTGPAEITLNGRFGNIVPVEDAWALGKAIDATCGNMDSARLLGTQGQRHVASTYCLDSVAPIYELIA